MSKVAVVESWPIRRSSAAASFGEIELSVSAETDSFTVARYRGQVCRSLTARGPAPCRTGSSRPQPRVLPAQPAQPRLVRHRGARKRIRCAAVIIPT